MPTVTSKDGTHIIYDKSGQGPAVILVDGALMYRGFHSMDGLAALLSPQFTVYAYDRRGRGESGDTQPFAVQREIEDIEALIDEAGGSAYLYGISSGAALALEATLQLGNKIRKLAIYEAPYNDDATARQNWVNYRQALDEVIAAGQPGEAVILFMKLVGMPDEHVPGVKQDPSWPLLESVGATLPYDAAALGEEAAIPLERAARIGVPTLVMDGSETYPFMRVTAEALAEAIPNAQYRTLEGQTHEVAPEALAPVLAAFFAA